ncbi:type 2 periplasmic-binding domain-containing protein [Anaerocolumna xylanovorans]|uniref:Multiple sugar transport system substrate-binding protein n=1 Tax=Anaerocolumna xylanovorans DSM 12503 TaxID=1121345 RepID=A0A1M7YDY4_9FIRM|nr:hypothetical protein [Anaerocolumna xylanovorans]SHO50852.1 multiple sugar transport system substrate-binding protein [Anaerocolumna xylanovorans DSM 12503]
MNKKKVIPFLINLLIILCLSGCSSEVKQTNKELTVYIGFNEIDMKNAVGVRGNSANKQNAYNFIKILLSDEVQRTPGTQVKGAIPVSYKVMNEIVYPDHKNNTFGEILNDFPKDCPEFTEEQQEEYMGYTKEVNKACFLPKWRDKLMEAMQPYLNGEMSYEECIKQAKEQVELYLSE